MGRLSAQLIALLAGIALFTSVIAFALGNTNEDDQVTRESAADLAIKAETLAFRLSATPGVPEDWEALPTDEIATLGLASHVDSPFTAHAGKLDRFRGAMRPPDALLANLSGLDGYGVHVRLEPALGVTPNGTVSDFAVEPLAYVAHRAGSVSASKRTAHDSAPALAEMTFLRELAFPFRPVTSGSVDFASLGDAHPDSRVDLARELVPRLAGFESVAYSTPAPTTGTWKLVHNGEYGNPSWWTSGTPETLLTTGDFDDATRAFVPTVQEHSVTLPWLDLRERSPEWSTTLTLTHWFDAGQPTPTPDAASVLVECLANCSASGEATVWSSVEDVGAKSAFVETAIDLSAREGELLRIRFSYDRNSLVSRGPLAGEGWFVSRVAIESRHDSETVVDHENALDYRTSAYRVLVVGSDVDHESFLASDRVVRTALTQWVVAGGRLLVLGSASADQAWLEPTFATSGAPLSASALFADASDLTHPLVTNPHELRVASLDWSALPYRPTADYVTALRGEEEISPGVHAPLLSATRASTAFEGAVVLATARPGLDDEPTVAKAALANWLAYALRAESYAELGDSVPAFTSYGSSSATLLVLDEERGTTRPVVITTFVWR